jgi:ABC-type nickel/cobalt efflux system permease component RcnA
MSPRPAHRPRQILWQGIVATASIRAGVALSVVGLLFIGVQTYLIHRVGQSDHDFGRQWGFPLLVLAMGAVVLTVGMLLRRRRSR